MSEQIISNETIDFRKISTATKIIAELQKELSEHIKNGAGPFIAAIYDNNGNLICKEANSVVNDNCSNNHAEINVIKAAEKFYNTYNLSPYNLKLYISAEPCIMCLGSIMWSGIKEIYYGVPSVTVEKITGFDEGFKPNWLEEFKKRGITVYGNIAVELGEKVLIDYIKGNKIIYKPSNT